MSKNFSNKIFWSVIADELFYFVFTLMNRWAGADVSRRNSISFVLDPICFASNAFNVIGTSEGSNKKWN